MKDAKRICEKLQIYLFILIDDSKNQYITREMFSLFTGYAHFHTLLFE